MNNFTISEGRSDNMHPSKTLTHTSQLDKGYEELNSIHFNTHPNETLTHTSQRDREYEETKLGFVCNIVGQYIPITAIIANSNLISSAKSSTISILYDSHWPIQRGI